MTGLCVFKNMEDHFELDPEMNEELLGFSEVPWCTGAQYHSAYPIAW